MEDFKQRVIDEKTALDEKFKALNVFMASDTFKSLDAEEQGLLRQQALAMFNYSNALAARIGRWKQA